jgi:hypothetical protein
VSTPAPAKAAGLRTLSQVTALRTTCRPERRYVKVDSGSQPRAAARTSGAPYAASG